METVVVEIRNTKARKLLEDLEELDLIHLVNKEDKKQKVDLSRFFNLLSKEEGMKRLRELEKDRKAWDKRNS